MHSAYFSPSKPQFSPIRPNLPPIPDYIEHFTSNKTYDQAPEPVTNVEPVKGHGRNPIYIPVNNKDTDIATTQQLFENLTPKNFLPPEVVDHAEHLNEIGPPNVQTKAKTPLIGDNGCTHNLVFLNISASRISRLNFSFSKWQTFTDIPISPGEVINTNSDVIFGRPTGNRPRIPLNSKLTDQSLPNFENAVPLNMLPPVTPVAAIFKGNLHKNDGCNNRNS